MRFDAEVPWNVVDCGITVPVFQRSQWIEGSGQSNDKRRVHDRTIFGLALSWRDTQPGVAKPSDGALGGSKTDKGEMR